MKVDTTRKRGSIDVTKVKRGHLPHKSGVGPHKSKRRKKPRTKKDEIV